MASLALVGSVLGADVSYANRLCLEARMAVVADQLDHDRPEFEAAGGVHAATPGASRTHRPRRGAAPSLRCERG